MDADARQQQTAGLHFTGGWKRRPELRVYSNESVVDNFSAASDCDNCAREKVLARKLQNPAQTPQCRGQGERINEEKQQNLPPRTTR